MMGTATNTDEIRLDYRGLGRKAMSTPIAYIGIGQHWRSLYGVVGAAHFDE